MGCRGANKVGRKRREQEGEGMAGEGSGVGGVCRKAARWKGGKREEGKYITVRGFRGLGWAGPSSAAGHASQTHRRSELTACSGATCHSTRGQHCNRGKGAAEQVQRLLCACGQTHCECVCVFKESRS